MKKIILLAIWLSSSFYSIGQTQVSGNQSGTWNAANSPYQVTAAIVIPDGQSLIIEPGVEINFQGYYPFTVKGKLKALGTVQDSILFTTDNQNLGWGGIRVSSSEKCELSFCRIEFGKTGLDYPNNVGGGLALFNANAQVANCVFAHNNANGDDDGFGGAVYAINSGVGDTTRFESCTFLQNYAYGEGGAIKFSNDQNTEIIGCTFIGNNVKYGGGAIAFYSSVNATVTQSLFVNNYTKYSNGGAIVALGFGNTLFFRNCTIAHNAAQNGEGGGVNLAYATADFVNSIIYQNPGKYGDDLYLSINGEAEVNYSNLKMPNDATGNNNIEVNPMFIDMDNLDYHLQGASECIDGGTDIGLPFFGEAPDMGCFEYGMVPVFELAQNNKVLLAPNPTDGSILIESVQLFDNLQVMNLHGQVVLSKDMNPIKTDRLALQDFDRGIYFVVLRRSGQEIGIQKVVME